MQEPGRLQSMGSLRVGQDWDFTFTFHFQALEKEMATHSSVLAWRIPGTGAAIYGVSQSQTRLKRLSSSSSSHHTGDKWSGSNSEVHVRGQESSWDMTLSCNTLRQRWERLPEQKPSGKESSSKQTLCSSEEGLVRNGKQQEQLQGEEYHQVPHGLDPPCYPGSILTPKLPYILPHSKKICFMVTLHLHILIHLDRWTCLGHAFCF